MAQGGMGEVYEVEDQALGGRLALKTVRPEIADDPKAAERFKREVFLARKITHLNVCRLHDFGVHRSTSKDGSERETLFLTMEFLDGATLSDRVRRGPMSTDEALPIVDQLTAGLHTAHALGIIHRDFKSGNVSLVRDPVTRTLRAVITDFGLARNVADAKEGVSISDSGAVVGTPAYMAPEQLEAKPLTPAADIYALGVVLYEMLTGRRPFDGGSAITVAMRRLTEAPASPRKFVPDLDPRWEAVVMRCLARYPEDRFQDAREVTRALRSEGALPSSIPTPTRTVFGVRAPSRSGRTGFAIAAAGIAVAIAVVSAWKAGQVPVSTPSPAAPIVPVARRSAAVMPLKNATGRADAQWLSTALAEMLATDLAAGGKLRVASGVDVAAARSELHLPDGDQMDGASVKQLRDRLGVEYVVTGSYAVIGGAQGTLLRIDLRLHDAAKGDIAASGAATGTEEQLFNVVSRAGQDLRTRLGLGSFSASEAVEVEASLPVGEAGRAYAEGLAQFRRGNALAARDLLRRAVEKDPRHPLPHAALAASLSALGHDSEAREEAKKAAAAAESLPPDQRLLIEGRFHEMNKDWAKAAEAYGTLAGSHPDDVEYGTRVAEMQTLGGRAKDALVTLERLRASAAASAEDPRIDLAEARAHQELGEFRQQQALAARAAVKAQRRSAAGLAARAHLLEATALENLGEGPQSERAVDEARRIYESIGDNAGVARAVERMGLAVYKRGDLDGARRLYERSLAVYREIGDEGGVARVLTNMGYADLNNGRVAEAEKAFGEALATFHRIGAKYEAAFTLNALGYRFHLRGDLDAAQKRYREALVLIGELGDKSGTALTLTNLAEVLYAKGDLREAQELHEESLAINRSIGEKQGAAYDTYRLGKVFTSKGDLRLAEGRLQEALQVQEQLGDKTAADTRLALAAVRMAGGQFVEAEKLAREAEEAFRGAGIVDSVAMANCALVEALVAQGKLKEAQDVLGRLSPEAKVEGKAVQIAITLAKARLRAAEHDWPGASESVERARAAATQAGFEEYAFDARLQKARLELSTGKRAVARAQLEALIKDAQREGFGIVARDAKSTLDTIHG